MNHSTVFRRIGAFEEALGVRLFDQLPKGYALTAAGEAMQRGGSVRLNSFGAPAEWISALVTPPLGLASAG